MGVVTELSGKPGVIAAGEYSYRGDRFSYRGNLSEEYARMASIMCRATTMSVVMQGDILGDVSPGGGFLPVRGWLLRGPDHTLCVVANVFCLIDNDQGSLNRILGFMRRALAQETMDLI